MLLFFHMNYGIVTSAQMIFIQHTIARKLVDNHCTLCMQVPTSCLIDLTVFLRKSIILAVAVRNK